MLKLGNFYNVTVIKIMAKGAIVSVEGECETQFIHISKLSSGYVRAVEDVVSVGTTYKAKCVMNTKLNKLELMILPKTINPMSSRQKSQSKTMSDLDKMIKAAQNAFSDKQKSADSRMKRRRR